MTSVYESSPFFIADIISLYRRVIVYQFICWWPSALFEALTDNNKTVSILQHLTIRF